MVVVVFTYTIEGYHLAWTDSLLGLKHTLCYFGSIKKTRTISYIYSTVVMLSKCHSVVEPYFPSIFSSEDFINFYASAIIRDHTPYAFTEGHKK